MAHAFPVLLENYRVLIYQGNFDTVVPASSTDEWLSRIDWKGREEFSSSLRAWVLNQEHPRLEQWGVAQSGGNLTHLLIVNSGHFVNMDQVNIFF